MLVIECRLGRKRGFPLSRLQGGTFGKTGFGSGNLYYARSITSILRSDEKGQTVEPNEEIGAMNKALRWKLHL